MLRIIMTVWKIVQRHTYDLLSHKYSLVVILLCISGITVSVFQFGEVWMTWSQEKYETVFNSFSDNIVGKSLQSKLCQNVPIDVVYTWVNGSDPILLQQLQHYRQQFQEQVSKKCLFANCVPSHVITIRHWLSDEAVAHALLFSGVNGVNVSLRHRVTVEHNNWTIIEVNSPGLAAEAVKRVSQSTITLFHAHWTSDGAVPDTIGDAVHAVLISGIPNSLLAQAGSILKADLTRNLQSEIEDIWIYSENKLVIIKVDSSNTVSRILQLSNNVTIGGNMVNTSRAYLIPELPFTDNSQDLSPSRFEDKEELRYSLRSLETYAPWVRHVYIVTNGQIPYWLDLENPRLTVVTHDQIFPNLSHLPTFSSPAIESHIHRIPGLSRKFLYLNDDVMFGKEVWPDDFITNANGQKVYLSWPVPDCSESCPWSWVADGSCDMSCNISECSFDGGDCELSTEDEIGLYDENRHLANYDDDFSSYHENQHHNAYEFFNDDLFHNINFGRDANLEDLPAPKNRVNSLLDVLIKKNDKNEDFKGTLRYLREGDRLKYMNPSDRNVRDVRNRAPGMYRHDSSNKFRVFRVSKVDSEKTTGQRMGSNDNNTQLHNEIYGGERNDAHYMQRIAQVQQKMEENKRIDNAFVTTGSKTKLRSDNGTSNDYFSVSYMDKLLINGRSDLHDRNVNDAEVHGEFYVRHTNQDLSNIKANKLKRNSTEMFVLLGNGQNVSRVPMDNIETFDGKPSGSQNINITVKSTRTAGTERNINIRNIKHKTERNSSSYNARLHNLYMKLNGKSDEPGRHYAKHNHAVTDMNLVSPKPQHKNFVNEENEDKVAKISKKKQRILRMYDVQQYSSLPSPGNKPRDTFAESLLYVNRLYNQEFGFEPRKVPAHMPHLINIDIMEHLQARFSQQWQLTSSHKVRDAHDMQFAFSYFYFLMSSTVTVPLSDIFNMFDTDRSGTWSDREIRTLLARSYDLPLSYARVIKFENDIINCSKELPEVSRYNIPTPPYEHYQDSKLPVVSIMLVSNCKPVREMLMKRFGEKKMYQYQVERDRRHDVSFKMLNSNISQLVSHLDDIRRDPKKFICLNDNLDPKRAEDNVVARAVLQDMYESLFPQPSSFELPPQFRNRFLHMTELRAWRTNRNIIRAVVYICLSILITFTLVNFFHVECRWLQRKLWQRTRQQYHRDTPLVTSV